MTVEYDGTDFAGFQLQEPGLRTVQGSLEAAIKKLSGTESRIYGAGRTDTGVHATGQVVHFDTTWLGPSDRIARALNGILPDDVTVRDAQIAPGFHARFDATARTYHYVILNRRAPSALLGRFSHHVRERLDTEKMQAAAVELTGTRDYATFGRPDTPGKSTVRRIERIEIEPYRKDCLRIMVRGNAFLRQQVRSFVGTLLLAGHGKLTPLEIAALRESRDRVLCPAVAPAKGLTLVRVHYDGTRLTRPEPPDGTEKD